jgi:hypothetical protein
MGQFMRILFGLALVILGVVAVLFLAKLTLPPTIEVPVASQDITGGTVIDRAYFRVVNLRGLDSGVRDALVTKDEFIALYEGQGVLADGEIVYAGFPLAKRQIVFPEFVNPDVDRLTLLTEGGNVVFPIDVAPGQVGNFVKAGDFVDLVFTVGRIEGNTIDVPPEPTYVPSLQDVGEPGTALVPTATPARGAAAVPANVVTPTPTPAGLEMPLAVISLPDVLVLKVERELIVNYAAASPGLGGESNEPAYLEGDVIRIYVELAPDDAAIAAFLLHSGNVVAPSHRGEIDNQPSGLTWTDFKNWYLSQRPDLFPDVDFPTPTPAAPAQPPAPTAEPTATEALAPTEEPTPEPAGGGA